MTKGESGDTVRRAWRYPPREEHPDVPIFIYADWCKCCGICAALCPAGVFTVDETGKPIVTNPDACTACYLCEKLCPDMAITVYKEKKSGGGAKPARGGAAAEDGGPERG
jgi:2-oxoglutarate ferredoxin oxidoreductase subunit delta